MTITLQAKHEDDTREIGALLARALVGAAARAPIVIGLTGDLGAGKTAFVRGFMAGLGRERDVSSPTYAIVNLYPGDPPVRHLDLYRLSTTADLEAIGIRDLYGENGLVLVEWIDRVPEARPMERLDVELTGEGDARTVRITAYGDDLARVLDALFTTVLAAFA